MKQISQDRAEAHFHDICLTSHRTSHLCYYQYKYDPKSERKEQNQQKKMSNV
jgi:hypothetical protein